MPLVESPSVLTPHSVVSLSAFKLVVTTHIHTYMYICPCIICNSRMRFVDHADKNFDIHLSELQATPHRGVYGNYQLDGLLLRLTAHFSRCVSPAPQQNI